MASYVPEMKKYVESHRRYIRQIRIVVISSPEVKILCGILCAQDEKNVHLI